MAKNTTKIADVAPTAGDAGDEPAQPERIHARAARIPFKNQKRAAPVKGRPTVVERIAAAKAAFAARARTLVAPVDVLEAPAAAPELEQAPAPTPPAATTANRTRRP